jgi:hypothetical protein
MRLTDWIVEAVEAHMTADYSQHRREIQEIQRQRRELLDEPDRKPRIDTAGKPERRPAHRSFADAKPALRAMFGG